MNSEKVGPFIRFGFHLCNIVGNFDIFSNYKGEQEYKTFQFNLIVCFYILAISLVRLLKLYGYFLFCSSFAVLFSSVRNYKMK